MTKQNLYLVLSDHFKLPEFITSRTASERHIDNAPTLVQVVCLQLLCINVLEPLRKHFGVIRISSGFRCKALNVAVGGASNSQHLLGEAADIPIDSRSEALDLYNYIRDNLNFDQLIWEPQNAQQPRWLHVSYTNRHKNSK